MDHPLINRSYTKPGFHTGHIQDLEEGIWDIMVRFHLRIYGNTCHPNNWGYNRRSWENNGHICAKPGNA